jgi:aspartate racemase
MKKSRCVGLLGGVGAGAASHYYSELAKASEARGFELDLVMVHAETPRVLEYVQAGDRAGLEAYFNGFFHRMKAAGAELAVIPSVTSHFSIQELRASAPLPLAVIFEPVVQEVARRSIRRVAVFGTRFVIRSRLYGFVPGLDFVEPRADEIDFIHDTYLRVALDGKGTQAQYLALRDLALRLIAREQLDGIVFGGTDLSLLFNESNTDFAAVDCAALHIRSIVEVILPPAANE